MIYNSFEIGSVNPGKLDLLLENGFRHFGSHFFRYNLAEHEDEIVNVIPLRVNLKNFSPSRSQRKVYKKNQDARVVFSTPVLSDELHTLFDIHKQKFTFGIPPSIHTFLGDNMTAYPCELIQVSVYDGNKLYSVSFLDIGARSTSSIYGFYDPEYSKRSPGIFTMLLEIEFSRKKEKSYYYSGYCYDVSSYYDYKKNFSGLEYFNWNDLWIPYDE